MKNNTAIVNPTSTEEKTTTN